MSLRRHEIGEANHRILNPLFESHLRLLGELAGAGPGTRILDLACGKGELLCRWAEWFGAGGVGVDLSEVFLGAAVERASALGVSDRVSFVHADAAGYEPERASFDVACCIGATWIGNGIGGTVDLLLRGLRDRGHILIGEPYWIDPPPAEALQAFGFAPDDFVSLEGTVGRIESAGLDLVEMVHANHDSWDRYEAMHWPTITDWLEANPDDPDWQAMRRFLDDSRSTYLAWGRRYLGWGVFVTRPSHGTD